MNQEELLYLLQKNNINLKKEFGQNFLINDDVIKKIVELADLDKNDTVLEIGAGLGNLTIELAAKVKEVLAVEPDNTIFPVLNNLTKTNLAYRQAGKNIIPINQGIFDIDFNELIITNNESEDRDLRLQSGNFKIVSNLPYQVTSHVFKQFLQHGPRPESMTVMVQKEVAERICAKKGQHSLLSLGVQFYSDPKIVLNVPKTDFFPSPKVESSVLMLAKIAPKYDLDDEAFFRILRMGFSAKRKKLGNNLENGLRLGKKSIFSIFKSLEIPENARAQELDLKTWKSLFDAVSQI